MQIIKDHCHLVKTLVIECQLDDECFPLSASDIVLLIHAFQGLKQVTFVTRCRYLDKAGLRALILKESDSCCAEVKFA